MFKNYFRTAWRNIRRNKIISFINIIGLAIGISASLLFYLLISFDLSFDKVHTDGNRIYRIVSDYTISGKDLHSTGVPFPMPNAVRDEISGLDWIVPLNIGSEEKLTIPELGKDQPTVYKKQSHIVFADERYFKVVKYEWLAGSSETSLQQPYQVVLTESNAKLYFPKLPVGEIIGRHIYLRDSIPTTVTGIVKNLKYNTDFTFSTFFSRATLESAALKPRGWDIWYNSISTSQLFLKLSLGTKATQVEGQINNLFKKYRKEDASDNIKTTFKLQPLSDLHFNATYGGFFQSDHMAHKPTLFSLLAIAFILLLLACINFINLTTAQSTHRAKEIGIRKTIGSSRWQLVFQFLSETFLLTLIATLVSILFTLLLLNVFSEFIPTGLRFNPIKHLDIIFFLALLAIAVSLLSGCYPAMVLSSFRPILVLKSQPYGFMAGTRSAFLRKALTVTQFVIAQVFIIATLLVSRQIHFSVNADLGFKKDAIIFFKTNYNDKTSDRRIMLLEKLKAIPGIKMISLSDSPPSSNSAWTTSIKYKGGKNEVETEVEIKLADTNYLLLYMMKLLAGSPLRYSDTVRGVIINETYSHALGFFNPEQAIGKLIEWDDNNVPIVGVVADFHQGSLHTKIRPLLISTLTSQERTINVALAPQNAEGNSWRNTLTKIGKAWAEVYPEDEFDFQFLDETVIKYYKSEQDILQLLTWATGLAIFISCLGLMGLVIYITNQRMKEIGLRKIMGASVTQLIGLLSADFLKLIVLAFLIAVPITWWGAHRWLDNFAYRTTLNWWLFFEGGLVMLLITFIILMIRIGNAALANPVKCLRTE